MKILLKSSHLYISFTLLLMSGLITVIEAGEKSVLKKMKIKKMLHSRLATEIRGMGGSIGLVKVGRMTIQNPGTRGEIAIITIQEHELKSWHKEKLHSIELRRYTSNSDTVLTDNQYYFVMLSPISGSVERYWLNEFIELEKSERSSIRQWLNKELSEYK